MPFIGEFSALLTAFLWSGTSIVFAEAGRRVGAIQINISRMILATVLLVGTIFVLDLDLSLSGRQYLYLALSGVIGLVVGDSFLFQAFRDIGPRVSMLVMSFVPAITAVLAYLVLDEALAGAALVGMTVTTVGIMVVVLDRRPASDAVFKINAKGLLYAFLGAAGQGAGLILAKIAFNEGPIHGMVATQVRIIASLIVFLPVALMLRWYKNPFRVFATDRKALKLTLLGAFIGPYLGITFSLIAIANTEVAVATTIMALPPIIMLPMVWYVYKERLSWKAVAGAFLAVAGVAVLFLR